MSMVTLIFLPSSAGATFKFILNLNFPNSMTAFHRPTRSDVDGLASALEAKGRSRTVRIGRSERFIWVFSVHEPIERHVHLSTAKPAKSYKIVTRWRRALFQAIIICFAW